MADLDKFKSYNLQLFFPKFNDDELNKIAEDLSLLVPLDTDADEDAVIREGSPTLSILSRPLEAMKDEIIREIRSFLATTSVPVGSAPMSTDPLVRAEIASLESTIRDLEDRNEYLRNYEQRLLDEIEEYQMFVEDLLTHVRTKEIYKYHRKYEKLIGRAMERIGDDSVARKIRDASDKVLRLDIPKNKKRVVRALTTKTIDELSKEENRNNGSWTRKWELFLLIIAGAAGVAESVYSGSLFQDSSRSSGSSTFTDGRTAAAIQQDDNIYSDPIFEEAREAFKNATPSQKRDANNILNAVENEGKENEDPVNDRGTSDLRVFNTTENKTVNTAIGPAPRQFTSEELVKVKEEWDKSFKLYLISNGILDASARYLFNIIVQGVPMSIANRIFIEGMKGNTPALSSEQNSYSSNGLVLRPTGRGLGEVVVTSFLNADKWDALTLSLTGALYAGLQIHPASQMLFVAVTWSRKVVALKVGYNILSELATGGIDFKNGAFQLTEDGEKVNLTEQLQKQAEEKQQKLADIVEKIEIKDLFQACQVYAFRKEDAVTYCNGVLQNYKSLNIYGKVNVIQSLVAMNNSVFSGEFPKELESILNTIEKIAKSNDLDLVHRIEQENKRSLGTYNDILERSFKALPNDQEVNKKLTEKLFEIGRIFLTTLRGTIRYNLPRYILNPDPANENVKVTFTDETQGVQQDARQDTNQAVRNEEYESYINEDGDEVFDLDKPVESYKNFDELKKAMEEATAKRNASKKADVADKMDIRKADSDYYSSEAKYARMQLLKKAVQEKLEAFDRAFEIQISAEKTAKVAKDAITNAKTNVEKKAAEEAFTKAEANRKKAEYVADLAGQIYEDEERRATGMYVDPNVTPEDRLAKSKSDMVEADEAEKARKKNLTPELIAESEAWSKEMMRTEAIGKAMLEAISYCITWRFKSECQLRSALDDVLGLAEFRLNQKNPSPEVNPNPYKSKLAWFGFTQTYTNRLSNKKINKALHPYLKKHFSDDSKYEWNLVKSKFFKFIDEKRGIEMVNKYKNTTPDILKRIYENHPMTGQRLLQQMFAVDMFEDMARTEAFEDIMKGTDMTPREITEAMKEDVDGEITSFINDPMRKIHDAVPLMQDKGYLYAVLKDNNTRSALFEYVEIEDRQASEILAKVKQLFDDIGNDNSENGVGGNDNSEGDNKATYLSLSSSPNPTGSADGLAISSGTVKQNTSSTDSLTALYSDSVDEYIKNPRISKYDKIRSSILRDKFEEEMKVTPLKKDAEDKVVAKYFKQLIDLSRNGEKTLHPDHIITLDLSFTSGEAIGSSGDLSVGTENTDTINENDVLRPSTDGINIVDTDSAPQAADIDSNVLRGEDPKLQFSVPPDDKLFRKRLQHHFELIDMSQSRINTRRRTLREDKSGAPKSDIASAKVIQISNIKPVRRQRKLRLKAASKSDLNF